MAQTQNQIRDRLLELTPAPTAEIEAAWRAAAEESLEKLEERESRPVAMGPEQWLVLVTCRDEKHQVEVLERLEGEGLEVKALVNFVSLFDRWKRWASQGVLFCYSSVSNKI